MFQHENRQLGLIGENFKALVQLATRLHDVEELKDTTSMEFVKESALEWLEARYKNTLQELLTDYVLRKAEAEIKDYEIWFPLHRTYLESSFPMGPVVFRTVTREMMDECEAKAPEQDRETAMAVQLAFARDRSAIQGCGAAAVKIRAEKNKALEIGREQADTAAALLRFLAPANWTPKLRSFCTLLGSENLRRGTELFLEGNSISGLSRNLLDRGDHQWVLSNAYLAHFPGILSRLHALSASPSRTPFQQALYEALLIHSRNSVAVEPADKLVYILVALESVLLRNTNEPLGKNIGERMAFLVGRSLEDRKAVVANVDEIYKLRSLFIHHGHSVSDLSALSTFMLNAWTCFTVLLANMDRYNTRDQLIAALEDRKMA